MMHINERFKKLCSEASAYVIENGVWPDGSVEDVVSLVSLFPMEMSKLVMKGIHPSPGTTTFSEFMDGLQQDEAEYFDYMVGKEIPTDEEMGKTIVPQLRRLSTRIRGISKLVTVISGMEKASTPTEEIALSEMMEETSKSFSVEVTGKADEEAGGKDGVVIGGKKPDDAFMLALKESYNAEGRLETGTLLDMWMRLAPGELGTILAQPGVGKTTAMVDVGAGYAENGPGLVIHFSEEMYTPQIAAKYATRLMGTANPTDKDVLRLHKSGRLKGRVYIESHPSGTSDVPYLISRVKDIMRKTKEEVLVAIIVDYIQILKSSKENKYESINENVIRLRSMLRKFSCRGWTGAQPQRNPSKENRNAVYVPGMKLPVLGMADVGECWAISQVTDYMVSINQSDEERDRDEPVCRIHAAKIRIPLPDCPKARTVKTGVDYATCRFV